MYSVSFFLRNMLIVPLVLCSIPEPGNARDGCESIEPTIESAKVIHPGKLAQFELQAALINATPGDVVELKAGTYHFNTELNVACDNVTIRGEVLRSIARQAGESHMSFLLQLRSHQNCVEALHPLANESVLAMLFNGDIDLPSGSSAYTLFSGQTTSTLSASDLLSS